MNNEMGRIMGLEPMTFGATNRRSNQLSYIRRKPRNFILLYCKNQDKPFK